MEQLTGTIDMTDDRTEFEKELGIELPQRPAIEPTPLSKRQDFPYRKISQYSTRHRKMLSDIGITSISNPREQERADSIIDMAEKANINKLTNQQIMAGEDIDTDADSIGIPALDTMKDIVGYQFRKGVVPVLNSTMQSVADYGMASARGLGKFVTDPTRVLNQVTEQVGLHLPQASEMPAVGEVVKQLYDKLGEPTQVEESVKQDRANEIQYHIENGDWANAYKTSATNFATDTGVMLMSMALSTGTKLPLGSKEMTWVNRLLEAGKEGAKFLAYEGMRNPEKDDEYRKALKMAVAFSFVPWGGREFALGLKKITGGKLGGDWTAALGATLANLGVQYKAGDFENAMKSGKEWAENMGKPEEAGKYQILSLIPVIGNTAAMALMTRAVRSKGDAEKMVLNETPIDMKKLYEAGKKIAGEAVVGEKGSTELFSEKSDFAEDGKSIPFKGEKPTNIAEVKDENATVQKAKPKAEGIPSEGTGNQYATSSAEGQKIGELTQPIVEPIQPVKVQEKAVSGEQKPIAEAPVESTPLEQARIKAQEMVKNEVEQTGEYNPTPYELLEKVKENPTKFEKLFDNIVEYADGTMDFRIEKVQDIVKDLGESLDYLDTPTFNKVVELLNKDEVTPNELTDATIAVRDSYMNMRLDYEKQKINEVKKDFKAQIRNIKSINKEDAQARIGALALMDYILKDKEYAASKMGGIAKDITKVNLQRKSFEEVIKDIYDYAEWSDKKEATDKYGELATDIRGDVNEYFPPLKNGIGELVSDIDTRTKTRIDGKMVEVTKPVAGIMKLIDAFSEVPPAKEGETRVGNARDMANELEMDVESIDNAVDQLRGVASKPYSQWKSEDVKALNDVLGMAKKIQSNARKVMKNDFMQSTKAEAEEAIKDADTSPTGNKVTAEQMRNEPKPFPKTIMGMVSSKVFDQMNHLDNLMLATFGDKGFYKKWSRRAYNMANNREKYTAQLFSLLNDAMDRNGFDKKKDLSDLPTLTRLGQIRKTLSRIKLGPEQKYRLSDNLEISMTPEEMINLRLTARDPVGRETLLKGEEVIDKVTGNPKKVSDDKQIAFENNGVPVRRLTLEELNQLTSDNMLTPKQRAFENMAWDFMNKDYREYGNNASTEIDGFERFLEEGRWHVRRKGGYTGKSRQEAMDYEAGRGGQAQNLPEHAGRFKKRVPGARARIENVSVLKELEEAIWEMARYKAETVPLREMRAVMKDGAVKDAIRRNQGEYRYNDINDMLSRVYGERQVSRESLEGIDQLTGNVARSLVSISPPALAKQPLSILPAIAHNGIVNQIKGIYNMIFSKEQRQLYKDVMEDSTLLRKRMRGTMLGEQLGKLVESEAFRTELTKKRSFGDMSMFAIRGTDKIGVQSAVVGAIQKALSDKGITAKDYANMNAGEKAEFLKEAGFQAWDSLLNGGQAVYGKLWASKWQGSDSRIKKLFGTFHAPMDQMYARQYRNYLEFQNSNRGITDVADYVTKSMMGYFVPLAISAYITSKYQYLKGDEQKKEMLSRSSGKMGSKVPFTGKELKEYYRRMGINAIGEVFGPAYIFGDLLKGALSQITYGDMSGGSIANPTLESIDDTMSKVVKEAQRWAKSEGWDNMSDEDKDKMVANILDTFADAIGKTTGVGYRSFEGITKAVKNSKLEDLLPDFKEGIFAE